MLKDCKIQLYQGSRSRWYIKRQILWFLFGSLLSTVAALACVALTSCGLHWKRNALEERQSLAAFRKYYALLDGDEESASTGYAVTVNIYLAAVAEAAWSAFSIKVAFEGARQASIQLQCPSRFQT